MYKKLKILHITDLLDVGGLESIVLELLKKINRSKYYPLVCTFNCGGALQKEFENADIPVYVIQKNKGIDLSLFLKMSYFIRKNEIDIVHTHNTSPWLYGGVATKILNNKILFHTEHANLYSYQKKLMLVEQFLAKFTNQIISDSKKVSDFLIDNERIPRTKIEIIFNGVDIDKYNKKKLDLIHKKRDLGISDQNVVIGIIARLSKVKNHKTLLRAFKIVSNNFDSAVLLVVGDGDIRDELSGIVNDLSLNNKVKFLGSRRDVAELLQVMDIFILSSISEGFPITPLEAMAASLPVILTNVGGNPEIVIDGITGLIVPPQNIDKMAEAMITLIKNRPLAKKMGEEGLKRVKEKFNLEHMVREYENLYEKNIDE